jgi:hypothetical protein
MDLPAPNVGCHRTGFTKSCRELVTREKNCCVRWVQIQGKHPQTGEDINECRCADDWNYILLLANGQVTRQTNAAVESLRNETIQHNMAAFHVVQQSILSAIDRKEPPKLIDGRDSK